MSGLKENLEDKTLRPCEVIFFVVILVCIAFGAGALTEYSTRDYFGSRQADGVKKQTVYPTYAEQQRLDAEKQRLEVELLETKLKIWKSIEKDTSKLTPELVKALTE